MYVIRFISPTVNIHKLLVKYLLISVGVMKVWAIPLLQRIIDCGWTNHSPELRHVTSADQSEDTGR